MGPWLPTSEPLRSRRRAEPGAGGEWALVHRCARCTTVRLNRIAGDDNPLVLMRLAVRSLAHPPFPREWLGRV